MRRSTPSLPPTLIKVILETDPETLSELIRFLDLFRNQAILTRTLLSVGQTSYHPALKGLVWPCEGDVKPHYDWRVIFLSSVSNFTHTPGLTLFLVVITTKPVKVTLNREQDRESITLDDMQISSQYHLYLIPPSPSESKPYLTVENRPEVQSVSYLLQRTI